MAQRKPKAPPTLNVPLMFAGLHNLFQAVVDYVEYRGSKEYNCDKGVKYEHAVFEAAIEFIYGHEIWDSYINLLEE